MILVYFRKALTIIDQYFVDSIVKDQDILGTEDRMDKFLELIEEDVRDKFKDNMMKVKTSVERWDVFLQTFRGLLIIVCDYKKNINITFYYL